MQYLQNAISSKCPIFKMPYFQNALFSKCLIFKMPYFQNALFSQCHIFKWHFQNAISSKCPIFKIPYFQNANFVKYQVSFNVVLKFLPFFQQVGKLSIGKIAIGKKLRRQLVFDVSVLTFCQFTSSSLVDLGKGLKCMDRHIWARYYKTFLK